MSSITARIGGGGRPVRPLPGGNRATEEGDFRREMVLPDRIELSTSPLPMECSTTELRQHARENRIGPSGPVQAGGSCHKAPSGASTRVALKGAESGEFVPDVFAAAGDRPDSGRIWFPIAPARPFAPNLVESRLGPSRLSGCTAPAL